MHKDTTQSDFFLHQLLDASIEGIIAFDLDCRYTAWNRAMERISGMRSKDVLGKRAFDLFPFLKQTGEDKCFLAALAGESSASDNTPYTVPETGRHGFFKGFYSPLRNEQDEIVGGIAVIHDITERKRAVEAAQEAHKRLTFHVENSPLAVIEWDSEARVSRWSQSAERLFGWKAEEVLGKHVSDWHFVFDEDVDAVAQVTHRQRMGAELLGVQRNRNYTRDGSVLFCEWYNSVLHDEQGKMVSVLSLVLDVTARKIAEEERTALLARERDLRKQAEEADRLKDEFLATLSHELRTPLTSVLGWATLIRTGEIDEHNVANAIQIIERNARAQARLIDDLLDVSRIITGNLQLDVHPLNLAPLVEAANEALRPAAEAKGIQIETNVDNAGCIVSGDPNRLRQVIWNLIMNAIKFTPRGGKVSVSLQCATQDPVCGAQSSSPQDISASTSSGNSYVRLTVTDNGEGIKPEFLPYVFHRFRQEESSISRKAGGLGLGLAVVRHLVELHGGSVSAESAGPGQGSTFIVELPLCTKDHDVEEVRGSSSEAARRAKGSPAPEPLAGVRVLLVEDDDDTRNLLMVLLKRLGAEVIATSSSSEALIYLGGTSPAVREASEILRDTSPTEQRTSESHRGTSSSDRGISPTVREGSDSLRDRNPSDATSSSDRGISPTVREGSDILRDADRGISPTVREGSQPSAATPFLPDIIISDLGMPDEDGFALMRKIRSLQTANSALSTQHLTVGSIPAIALTGYATKKDRERALEAGYQLHLAKPIEPEELVNAILSLVTQGEQSQS